MDIDTEDTMIPTLLLQPILENAFLHADLSRVHHATLLLLIENTPKGILYTITDNGICLENSQARNDKNGRKSRGMMLIQKQLNALGRLCGEDIILSTIVPFPNSSQPDHSLHFRLPHTIHELWRKLNSK